MVARTFSALGWLVALGTPPTASGADALVPAPCAGEHTALNSQQQVLEFAALQCEVLGGDLSVTGSSVRDLRPLAGLRKITGTLRISGTRLQSLDGLDELTTVGVLVVDSNPVLESFVGLENVSRIPGALEISSNQVLRSISSLRGMHGPMETLDLCCNAGLKSLDGLHGISSVSLRLFIQSHPRLASLRPLAGLRSDGPLPLSMRIVENPSLTSLEGLEGVTRCWTLEVRGNAQLGSLSGLRNIGGRLIGMVDISWNDRLESLRGLEGVSSAAGLVIVGNTRLRSLAALGGLRELEPMGGLRVVSNPELRSLHGLQHLTGSLTGGVTLRPGVGPVSLFTRCISVTSNARLESVEALAGVFGSTPSPTNCSFEFRQQLNSFQLSRFPLVDGEFVLGPSVRCFPLHSYEPLTSRFSNAWTLPLPHWDEAQCRECEKCGIWDGVPVHCDMGSGRCRCPLGRQGTDCASPAPRVRVVPQQRFACAQADGLTAIVCTVRIALQREGRPRTPPPGLPGLGPDFFGVYAAGAGALSARENGTSHGAVWTNETHGSISVALWSRHGGDPAALELRVGYLPDIQPAQFLEGTVPSPTPTLENTIFPWCVDSEDCSLTAPERIEVVQCPPGWMTDDGTACARCPVGRRSANGECNWDWALLLGTGGAFVVLLVGSLMLAAQAEAGGIRSRRIPVQDVSREGGRVVLSTWGRHRLHMGLAKSFRVRLAETGHPGLDAPKEPLRARAISPYQLELLDARGEPLRSGSFNTSQGSVQLPLCAMPMHTGWPVPVAFSAPALLTAGACWLAWLCAWRLDNSSADAPTWWALLVVGAALVGSAIGPRLRDWHSELAPLQRRRQAYDARRSNGTPAPVARGAERAITAGQLMDFHDHFQEFVRDRDMYYVVANIVKPLTADSRLSFAEYVGPSRLAWFASHFWGNSFRHLCTSIQRHAEAAGDWARHSYWICSFSINQHAILEEIGDDHMDSSFFLALRSGSCRGTCMVVDEQALPLTRSWCLFELLQTIKMEREATAGFEGLFFCTSTGVLNFGRASVETSMALGRRLTALRLEDADASTQVDKAMIDGLVVNDMGGFDAMNSALRSRISVALRASKETAVKDFELLERALSAGWSDAACAPEN